MLLSVVIPAFNEQERLHKTLEKVKNYLKSQKYEWEVIVVNDGSKDQTAQVVKDLIKDWDNFKLIDNKENKGKGGVVKQGMLIARGDLRLFMDADNSTDISELPKLWKFANSKHEASNKFRNPKQFQNPNDQNSKQYYDIVIGSRYLNKNSIKIKQPLSRRVVSRLGNFLVRILLGIKSVDTQCGFKLFSKKATLEIFPKQQIMRWGFDMEILAIAIRKGYKIKEVPVDWYDAEGSTVKKGAAFKALRELLSIKWKMMTGKYH